MSKGPLSDTRRKLLLLDPYPRNNPYRMTTNERRAFWFPQIEFAGHRRLYPSRRGT